MEVNSKATEKASQWRKFIFTSLRTWKRIIGKQSLKHELVKRKFSTQTTENGDFSAPANKFNTIKISWLQSLTCGCFSQVTVQNVRVA